jgi:lysine-specific demethylase 3
MSNRYNNHDLPRCVSCTRRWAGDTCRFQGVRSLFTNSEGDFVGFAFQELRKDEPPVLQFPDEWNIPLHESHIHETKVALTLRKKSCLLIYTQKTIAAALLPTLREELDHIGLEGIVNRPRESDVRATCGKYLSPATFYMLKKW